MKQQMKDILQDIMANKRIEVERQKQAVQLQTLLGLGGERLERPTRSMRAALAASSSGIIAEFKRKSPSKGWLHPDAAVADVLPAYEKGGASACSVLTDSNFFGGSLGDLCKARNAVDLPLLKKDFIIDEYQLYQARVMGADAVLLIAHASVKDATPCLSCNGCRCRPADCRLPYSGTMSYVCGVSPYSQYGSAVGNPFRRRTWPPQHICRHVGGEQSQPRYIPY